MHIIAQTVQTLTKTKGDYKNRPFSHGKSCRINYPQKQLGIEYDIWIISNTSCKIVITVIFLSEQILYKTLRVKCTVSLSTTRVQKIKEMPSASGNA